MKKLITVIAAAVMGFAYGDGLKNTVGFEDLAANSVLDTTKDDTGADTGDKFWYAGAEELGTITAYDTAAKYEYTEGERKAGDETTAPGLNFLALDSGSTVLYRTITSNDGTGLPTATDIDEGLFFDSLVKFTVTEYDPAAAATVDPGTKLAIWLGQAESDEGDAPTNLIVTAAIWDATQAKYVASNFVATTTADVTDGAWHRVTARAIKYVSQGKEEDNISGFTLFIDGVAVGYADAPEYLLAGSATPTTEANLLLGKGQLFLNLMSGVNDATKLAGFGFKGTGSIDDVSITDKANAPLFAKGQKQLSVSWDANVASITINDNALDLTGKSSDVVMLDEMTGNTIAVTYATGYVKGAWTMTGATVDGTTLTLQNEVAEIDVVSAPEMFQVGQNKYGTFAEALEAAGAEGTISLVADYAAGAAMIQIGKDSAAEIVIDLAGKDFIAGALEGDVLFCVNDGSKLTVIDSIGGGKMAATYAGGDEFLGLFYGDTFIGATEDDEGATFDSLYGEIGDGVIVKGFFLKTANDKDALEDDIPETGYQVKETDPTYYEVCAAEKPTQKFSGGEGTVEKPYLIANTNDLIELQADVDSGVTYAGTNFLQTADIDMDGLIWTGIGKKSSDSGMGNGSFKGIYDGGNHAITNLLLSSAKVAYVGLFSSINGNCGTAPDYGYTGAAVKNLTICLDPNTSVDNGGAVAGFVAGALIANVTVKGAITGAKVNDSNLGCFFGCIYCNTLVSNCVNWATANNSNKRTGGFSGHASNSGNLINGGTGPNNGEGIQFVDCVNNGTINAPGEKAAGFVGGHDGGDYNCIFIRCTNNGTIGQGDNGYQFINCGANGRWAYTGNKCKPDQLTCNSTIDGLNFGVVNDDVVTLITNAEVVVGGEYKVMSKIGTLPVTFDTVGQTIAFDVALNATFAPAFTLTNVGLSAVTNDTLITYSAIKLPANYTVTLSFSDTEIKSATINEAAWEGTPQEFVEGTAITVAAVAQDDYENVTFKIGEETIAGGAFTLASNTVVTITATQAGGKDWPTNPEDPLVKGKTADEAFPGKVPTALANVPAANFAAWAIKAGIDFANPGEINVDAYLLNCAEDELAAEKAKFVITSIAFDGEKWVVTVANEFVDEEPYNANATVKIVDITDEFDEALTEKTDAKGFFKAELKAITLTK